MQGEHPINHLGNLDEPPMMKYLLWLVHLMTINKYPVQAQKSLLDGYVETWLGKRDNQ